MFDYTFCAMSFGNWLLERRQAKNLKQVDVAKRVGISVSYVSALEREEPGPTGKIRKPTVEIVDKIARALSANKDEARVAAGFAPEQPLQRPKPQNVAELMERLHELGVDYDPTFLGGVESIPDDPELLADILADFATLFEMRVRKRHPRNEQNTRGLPPG
jgi:transcriptional regulator with XRE-family HTH domain